MHTIERANKCSPLSIVEKTSSGLTGNRLVNKLLPYFILITLQNLRADL